MNRMTFRDLLLQAAGIGPGAGSMPPPQNPMARVAAMTPNLGPTPAEQLAAQAAAQQGVAQFGQQQSQPFGSSPLDQLAALIARGQGPGPVRQTMPTAQRQRTPDPIAQAVDDRITRQRLINDTNARGTVTPAIISQTMPEIAPFWGQFTPQQQQGALAQAQVIADQRAASQANATAANLGPPNVDPRLATVVTGANGGDRPLPPQPVPQAPPLIVFQNMPEIANIWGQLTPEQQHAATAQAQVIADQRKASQANAAAAAIQDSGYDPLAGAITAAAGTVKDVAGAAAEAVVERTPDPVKEGIAKGAELLDKPRQIVGRRLGGEALRGVVNASPEIQAALIAALPPGVQEVLQPILTDPEVKEKVNAAYAEGGSVGVWENVIAAAGDDMNPFMRAIYLGTLDSVFDPVSWTGAGKAAGASAQAATAGTKLGRVGEAVAAATKGVDVAVNLPGEAVVGAVKGVGAVARATGRGVNQIPVIGGITGRAAGLTDLSPKQQARNLVDETTQRVAAEAALDDASLAIPRTAPTTSLVDQMTTPNGVPAIPQFTGNPATRTTTVDLSQIPVTGRTVPSGPEMPMPSATASTLTGTPALPARGTSLGVIEMPERMGPLGVPGSPTTRTVPQPLPMQIGDGGSRIIPLQGVDDIRVRSRDRGGSRYWVAQARGSDGRWNDVGTITGTREVAISEAQRLATDRNAPLVSGAGVQQTPLAAAAATDGAARAPLVSTNPPTPAGNRQLPLAATGATRTTVDLEELAAQEELDDLIRQGRQQPTAEPKPTVDLEELAAQEELDDLIRSGNTSRESVPSEPPIDETLGEIIPNLPDAERNYLTVDTRPERVRVRLTDNKSHYIDAEGKTAPLQQYVADVVRETNPQGADDFLRVYAQMAQDKRTLVDPVLARWPVNSAEHALSGIRFYAERMVPAFRETIGDKLPRYRWVYGEQLGSTEANLIEHLVFGSKGSTADQALARLLPTAAKNPRLAQRVREAIEVRNQYAATFGDDLAGMFSKKSKRLEPLDMPQSLLGTARKPEGGLPPARGIYELDPNELVFDAENFQPRSQRYNTVGVTESSVDDIVTNFDPDRMDPIKVWRRPDDGALVVISGHHRTLAARKLGIKLNGGIVEGDLGTAKRVARRSNSITTLKPTEYGRAIRAEMNDGADIAAAAGQHKIKRTDAERYVQTSHLPQNLQELVDNGQFPVPQAARLGKAVQDGVMSPAAAQSFFETRMLDRNYTVKDLDNLFKGMADQVQAQPEIMDMFGGGGFDFGSAQNAAQLDRMERLGELLTRAESNRRSLKGLTKSNLAIPQDKARLTAVEKEITTLRKDMAESAFIGNRAAPGGEIGMNGEFYPGGTFLPNTTLPKRKIDAKTVKGPKKELIAPREWAERPEGQRSLYSMLAGNQAEMNGAQMRRYETGISNYGENVRVDGLDYGSADELIARYNAGERWTSPVTPSGGSDEMIDLAADGPLTYSTVIPGLPQVGEYIQRVIGRTRANRATARANESAAQASRQAFSTDLNNQTLSGVVGRQVPRSAEDEAFWATPLKGGTRETVWRAHTAAIEEGRSLLARLRPDNRAALLRLKDEGGTAAQLKQAVNNANLNKAEQKRLLELLTEYENGLVVSTDARKVAGAAMAKDYEEALGVNVDPRTKLGRFYDEATGLYREVRLLAPWNALRYHTGNLLGATTQTIIAKNPMAAFDALSYQQIKKLTKYVATGEDAYLKDLHLYKTYEQAEMGGIRPEIAQGRTDMILGSSKGTSATRRVFGKIGAGWVGRPIEAMRNLGNGIEASIRLSIHEPQFTANLIDATPEFSRDAAALMKRLGVPDAETYAAIAELGPIFGPVRLRTQLEKAAIRRGVKPQQAYGTAHLLAKKWRGVQNRADAAAQKEVNRIQFSYQETNLDAKLRRVLPFHMWATRALPFYLENMAKNPVAIAAFYRANEGMDRLAEKEGWPKGLKGFVALAQSAGGYELFLSPMATLGVIDLLAEGGMGEPDDESGLGKWLRLGSQFAGVGVFPWFNSALNMAGFLGDSYQLDPTGMSREWGLFAYGANWLAANGYIDAEIVPRGPDDLWRRVREKVSGITEGRLPGAKKIEATNSNAYPLIQISQRTEEIWRENNGIAPDQPLTPDQFEDLNVVLSDADSPEAVQARKDWAQSGVAQAGLSLIVPGFLKTRQSGEQARRDQVNAAYDGVVTNDDVKWWKDYKDQTGKTFTNEQVADQTILINQLHQTVPDQRPIVRQGAEYYNLGTEQERAIYNQYNDIAFGDSEKPVVVGGVRYTPEQLRAMPDEQRRDLATSWLIEKGWDDEYDTVKGLRDSYTATHPEWAAYQSWATDARKAADGVGGAAAWRAQVSRENPNAAAYFDRVADKVRRNAGKSLTPSEFAAEMDKETFTLSAYLAYQGRQERHNDPPPPKQDLPLLGPMGTGAGGNSGGSNYGGQDASFSARLARAVPETLALVAAANADASARSGAPVDVMNQPEAIKAWLMSKYPELTTEDANIAFEYLAWAEQRRAQGLNDSQASYIREQGWTANNPAPPNALEVAIQGSRSIPRSVPSLTSGGGGRAVPSLVG